MSVWSTLHATFHLAAQALTGSDAVLQALEPRAAALEDVGIWPFGDEQDTGAWNIGTRAELAPRLQELVREPGKLDQAATPWCNQAAFLYIMFKRWPRSTARWAMTLFEEGAAALGPQAGNGLEVAPNPSLLGFELTSQVRGHKQGIHGPLQAVDFMLMAALHDQEEGGTFDPSQTWKAPGEDDMEEWFDDSDFYGDVEDDVQVYVPGLVQVPDSLDNFLELDPTEEDIVFVHKLGPLAEAAGATAYDSYDFHAAVLLSKPVLEDGRLTYTFWSWGLPVVTFTADVATSGTPSLGGDYMGAIRCANPEQWSRYASALG